MRGQEANGDNLRMSSIFYKKKCYVECTHNEYTQCTHNEYTQHTFSL